MASLMRLPAQHAFKRGAFTSARPRTSVVIHRPARQQHLCRSQPPESSEPKSSRASQQAAPADVSPAAAADAASDEPSMLMVLNPIQYLLNVLEPRQRSAVEMAGRYLGGAFITAVQAVILVCYISFWWSLTEAVWVRTSSALSFSIPVGVLVFNEWLVLKVLVACYFATALNAWPLLIGKLIIDAIHTWHSHDLRSFPRSIRILAAVLGRNLRAPVLANYTWIQYTQQELSGFEPITGPLSDNTDTTVFKWQSLWDIVWMVGVIWFLISHLVIYEANWGDLFKGTGFTYARLGSWHMPEFPRFWQPMVGGSGLQLVPTGMPNLWGPFPVT